MNKCLERIIKAIEPRVSKDCYRKRDRGLLSRLVNQVSKGELELTTAYDSNTNQPAARGIIFTKKTLQN